MFRLIILQDPDDKEPPSAQTTLNYWVKAGKRHGVNVLLRTLKDIDLSEGDALFLRQTTEIGNGVYWWAQQAQYVGMPVIDDPVSIRVCCNKIETYSRFLDAGVSQPDTWIARCIATVTDAQVFTYPLVLKEPDSCFSRGVFRIDNPLALLNYKWTGDPVVLQEYLPTDFDWRVGVLNGKILYCCKYFMPKGHWQIIKRYPSGYAHLSKYEVLKAANWPEEICQLALQAAACVGDGLYGVDIKETYKGPVVIEINDNPSIDSDAEGKYGVWDRIIERFKEMANGRKPRRRQSVNRDTDFLRGDCANTN